RAARQQFLNPLVNVHPDLTYSVDFDTSSSAEHHPLTAGRECRSKKQRNLPGFLATRPCELVEEFHTVPAIATRRLPTTDIVKSNLNGCTEGRDARKGYTRAPQYALERHPTRVRPSQSGRPRPPSLDTGTASIASWNGIASWNEEREICGVSPSIVEHLCTVTRWLPSATSASASASAASASAASASAASASAASASTFPVAAAAPTRMTSGLIAVAVRVQQTSENPLDKSRPQPQPPSRLRSTRQEAAMEGSGLVGAPSRITAQLLSRAVHRRRPALVR
ncbi:hypothetical protein OF83DRAFT_1175627, partial [Amylostereum chailletii]